MNIIKRKTFAFFLALGFMLNAVFPFGFLLENTALLNNIMPDAFNAVMSACAPIDAVGSVVSKIMNKKNAADSPAQKDNKHEEKKNDGNILFVLQGSASYKYSKSIKDVSAGSAVINDKILIRDYSALHVSNLSRTPAAHMLIFMLLLAYISILYRDVWVNKINNNFKTCGVL